MILANFSSVEYSMKSPEATHFSLDQATCNYREEFRSIPRALRKRIEIWHGRLRNPDFRLLPDAFFKVTRPKSSAKRCYSDCAASTI